MKKPVRPIKPLRTQLKASYVKAVREYTEIYYIFSKRGDPDEPILLKYEDIHIDHHEHSEEEVEDFNDQYSAWFSQYGSYITIKKLLNLCIKYKLDPNLTTLSQAWLWPEDPSLSLEVKKTRTEKEIEAVKKENERKRKKYEADLKKYEKDLAKYKRDKARWDIEQAKKKLAKLS